MFSAAPNEPHFLRDKCMPTDCMRQILQGHRSIVDASKCFLDFRLCQLPFKVTRPTRLIIRQPVSHFNTIGQCYGLIDLVQTIYQGPGFPSLGKFFFCR